jgi:hypothetical protein
MAIILKTDFLDNPIYDIALTRQADKELDALIDAMQSDMFEELLGCDLYDLFIADLSGTPGIPHDAIYLNIFNSICSDDDCVRSYGMKDMLMGFVYFEWHRYNQNKSVAAGIVRIDSENSTRANLTSTNIYDKYNRAVQSYQSIQEYINLNLTDYPLYQGIKKRFSTWI